MTGEFYYRQPQEAILRDRLVNYNRRVYGVLDDVLKKVCVHNSLLVSFSGGVHVELVFLPGQHVACFAQCRVAFASTHAIFGPTAEEWTRHHANPTSTDLHLTPPAPSQLQYCRIDMWLNNKDKKSGDGEESEGEDAPAEARDVVKGAKNATLAILVNLIQYFRMSAWSEEGMGVGLAAVCQSRLVIILLCTSHLRYSAWHGRHA